MGSSLRIIGGAWRRHQIPIAPVQGLRPTPDRVRETLFNWLGQDCTGMQVLDLFSGTGALGFEAASRGAARVCLVENDPLVFKQLQRNRDYLLSKWPSSAGPLPVIDIQSKAVERALGVMASRNAQFDWIALDPPFGSPALAKVLPMLKPLLKPDGLIYIEWNTDLFADPQALAAELGMPDFRILKYLKAGQVHAHLLASPVV